MGKTQRRLSYVVVALVAAAVTGGVSWADSGGGGTIQACVNDTNGNTRIVTTTPDDCRTHEIAKTWNVIGPPGPTGPRGPSDAYDGFRNPNHNIAITGSDAARTQVLSFPLPAGNFAITSKVNVSAGSTGGGLVHCMTSTASGWWDMGVASIGPRAGETLEDTLSTTFTAQEANPRNLNIYCWRINPVGNAPVAALTEAVAIQLANATYYIIP